MATTENAGVALDRRIEAARESTPYQHYLHAREAVLRMKSVAAGDDRLPSVYWQDELGGFEYMLDASPLVIDRLREHTFHITGIRPYDYRSGKEEGRRALSAKLDALAEIGSREYLIPEHPALGGFGHEIDGALYNVDTAKFFEVLTALDKGAVLKPLRESDSRLIVWEIGAGWGGFAYQWKTLVPETTYVIVDLPELFLFSATYLATVFPEARIRFWQVPGDEALFADWQDCDFILVPHTGLADVRPPHLDLAVNMVSFQEMTTSQVAAYVEHAHEIGAPYLYSLNRDRSAYNKELTSVRKVIARHFWPREIPILPVSYGDPLTKSTVGKSAKRNGRPRKRDDYRHVIGWRRSDH